MPLPTNDIVLMSEEKTTGKVRAPRDPSATIRRILGSAREEFASNGFDGTKMEHIARRAKVSKQLVYFYFNSKDELYSELSKEISLEVYDRLLSIDYAAMSPESAIRAYIGAIYDHFLEDPAIAVVAMDQSLHHGAQIRVHNEVRRMQRELCDRLDQVLCRGRAEKRFCDDIDVNRLEFLSMVIVSGCVSSSGMFERYTGRLAGQNAAFWRDHAVDFILRALRA